MSETTERFQLRGTDAEATGYPTENGFVVCEGAIARKDVVPSARTSSFLESREKLIADGILQEFEGHYRFTRDHEFGAPSTAAAMVLGRTSNGWIDRKHSDGRTLSELRRVSRAAGTMMLSDAKRERIQGKYEELLREGKLYTEAQLQQYYRTFAERFAPSQLAGLDGEELLEYLHGSSHDSLAYWLEFKNDDEFPTKDFGSIAGGAALKFRLRT